MVGNTPAWPAGPAAFPFSVSTYAFPTNYEQDSRAVLLGAAPRTGAFIDSNGDPNVFRPDPPPPARFVLPIRANPASATIFAARAISAWI